MQTFQSSCNNLSLPLTARAGRNYRRRRADAPCDRNSVLLNALRSTTTMSVARRTAASLAFRPLRTLTTTIPRRPPSYVPLPSSVYRFSASAFRHAQYQRFGSGPGTRRTRILDGTRWDTRTKVLVGLASFAGVYYIAQCVVSDLVPSIGSGRAHMLLSM